MLARLPLGFDASLSLNLSAARHTRGGPKTAKARSWDGLFYGGTVDLGPVPLGAGVFWDPKGAWIGSSVGAGLGAAIVKSNPQAYFLVQTIPVHDCVCYALILAMG
jgi:hypothetical protein